jgi:hypothetical protein
VIYEECSTSLNGVHGNGRISRPSADATKELGIDRDGLRANKLTVGSQTPKVGTAGTKEDPGDGTKGADQFPRIAALKSCPGQLQKKLLEGNVRLRRGAGNRISGWASQWRIHLRAKRLKTIELHINRTLKSQFESKEISMEYRVVNWH